MAKVLVFLWQATYTASDEQKTNSWGGLCTLEIEECTIIEVDTLFETENH